MRPAAEIVEEIRRAAAQGHREVHLLGQIVNHYQDPAEAGCDFSELLERVNSVEGIERIRFASPHPRHVTPRMLTAMADLPKGLSASASTRAVGVDGDSRVDAQATQSAGVSRSRWPGQSHCPEHRPIDRYDYRVPW